VEATPRDPERVGVVLVHGIGRQRRGDTTAKFVRGLRRAYRRPLAAEVEGSATVIRLPGRDVRVYEAYWADVLANDLVAGTFDPFQVHVLAWFPWLNLRTGLYDRRPRIRVGLWTLLLAPAAIGVQVLWGFTGLVAAMFKRSAQLSAALDEIVADVVNYVDSAAGAIASDSPLHLASSEVHGRFDAAVAAAVADGCGTIDVVAHSLGTVIAAKRLFAADADPAAASVDRLYTIGSPLRRVRFLWPHLFAIAPAAERSIDWRNFWDPFDLVSNRLTRTPAWSRPRNSMLLGRAGLARAHVTYEAHARFIRRLADGIGAERPPFRPRPLLAIALMAGSLAESVGLVLVVAAGLLVGLLIVVLFSVISAFYSAALSASFVGPDTGATIVHISFWGTLVLFLIVYFVVVPLGYGLVKASAVHRLHRGDAP
jgi:hypothetical protein